MRDLRHRCFMGAISIKDGAIFRDMTLCKGCGICATVCPNRAVSIEVDDLGEAVSEIMGRIRQRINIE